MSDAQRRAAAALLGRAATLRKAAAARRNGLLGGDPGIRITVVDGGGTERVFGRVAVLVAWLAHAYPNVRIGARWGVPRINLAIAEVGLRAELSRGKGER